MKVFRIEKKNGGRILIKENNSGILGDLHEKYVTT